MSRDQHSGDETPTLDTDALGAWVAETAAKKDISERELLDEILSSYWVLEELSDVVLNGETDPESGDHPATRRDSYTEPTRGAATDRDRYPTDTREQPTADDDHDDVSTAADEPQTESEPPTESASASEEVELSEIEQELGKLRTVINELAAEESLPTPEEATAADSNTAADSDPTTDPTTDTNPTTDTDEETAEIEESIPAIAEGGPNSPGALAELDDELVEIRERLSALEADLTDQVAAESEAREELEAWIETEFDNVEDVLQHLLSTTDNLEYRLGSAIESQREQLEPLEAAHADRKQLRELKNEAIEIGVTTADCGNCEETIDLRLLPAPHCPSCEQEFTGVTDSSWWPFDSATLQTATARRPQADHSWETTDQQPQTASRESNQNNHSSSAAPTDKPDPNTDAEPRPDENGFDQFDA